MSNRDLTLAMRLYADASRFVAGLTRAEGGVRKFGGVARREFDALKGTLGTVQGKLASIGVSVGAVATLMQSARMDKSLAQLGLTAGVSSAEVAKMRKELHEMAKITGQSVDDLQKGLGRFVAAGLNIKQSQAALKGVNEAMAVTGANADVLAGALTVAAQSFNIDLSSADKARETLEKMTVAGRLGNAELEGLSNIFARFGSNAASAGMSFDKTLVFIEGLSKADQNPERLATLADSTLRLFTNRQYMEQAARATGIGFFDRATGSSRDPLAVLKEFKGQYDKLKTDAQRFNFFSKAFGTTDLDTQRGLRNLFGGGILDEMITNEKNALKDAAGTFSRDMPIAVNNAVDQVGRLRESLREAAYGFAEPINETISNLIKYSLDSKENGGLELSGKEMLVGGSLGLLGLFGAARYGGKGISALAKRFGGTAAGVVEGKALEAAAGVAPVFVVNWPASMGPPGTVADVPGGLPGAKKGLPLLAAGVPVAVGAGAAYSFYQAYEAYGRLSETQKASETDAAERRARREEIDRKLYAYGGTKLVDATKNYDFQQLNQVIAGIDRAKEAKVGGVIEVRINQEGRATSVRATTKNPRVPINVDNGLSMRSF